MLLVLPELCLTGYTCNDLLMQDALHRAALRGLDAVVQATRGNTRSSVMPLVVRHSLYNCAAVLYDGQILGIVPKTALPNYGEFYEKRIFAPAPDFVSDVELLGQNRSLRQQAPVLLRNHSGFHPWHRALRGSLVPVAPSTGLALARCDSHRQPQRQR